MGAGFSAVFPHRLNGTEIAAMAEKLAGSSLPVLIGHIKEIQYNNPHVSCSWCWEREQRYTRESNYTKKNLFDSIEEELECRGTLLLKGPAGIDLLFSRHMCELQTGSRWVYVLSNPEYRESIRAVCCEIAGVLDAQFAVYMADSCCASDYLYDEHSMEYYLSSLHKRFGPPAKSLDVLLLTQERTRSSEGYFIDFFQQRV
ncbi:hypothetical protein PM3016_3398 [Paenibacillus mucilaginosus 3016]|uniref:Uncharacterized protein n=1 Tax=Paenibacillus mucilaginosus 3016 TaxID=1116391 RepID=H6NJT7_9BACL|nr:hypothetical protein [Paenibacillus mucilaginosus]AFC30241.1 hypothetical protein PM3016_3398 [Paenibacillus mucilaginosus 3016]WFA18885.1 hypothetical protein ERY13_17175 [Paenibacillus mucilaginosus]